MNARRNQEEGERVIRIGVISAYPGEDWHAQRIAAAAARRGEVRLLSPLDFAAEVVTGAPRIRVQGEPAEHYDLFLTPRAIGDAGDAELQLALYQTLAESGALLVNDVDALSTAIDKFRSSWLFARANLASPAVRIAQRWEDARRALAALGQVVVKPLYGSLGIGVERVSAGEEPKLAALFAEHGALYLQAYVAPRLDVRAFVVGGRVEAAVARRPRPGEFRANIHQGARAEPIAIDADASRLAISATSACGLDYSGVDLLLTDDGPLVLEVNGTPAFRNINAATHRDMAEAIVAHAVLRAKERADGRSAQGRREGRDDRQGGGAEGWRPRRTARRRDHPGSLRSRVLRGDR
ncbi:MAG: RimK family alpha-L-glutamate ligase [Polyangia bacterium]